MIESRLQSARRERKQRNRMVVGCLFWLSVFLLMMWLPTHVDGDGSQWRAIDRNGDYVCDR